MIGTCELQYKYRNREFCSEGYDTTAKNVDNSQSIKRRWIRRTADTGIKKTFKGSK